MLLATGGLLELAVLVRYPVVEGLPAVWAPAAPLQHPFRRAPATPQHLATDNTGDLNGTSTTSSVADVIPRLRLVSPHPSSTTTAASRSLPHAIAHSAGAVSVSLPIALAVFVTASSPLDLLAASPSNRQPHLTLAPGEDRLFSFLVITAGPSSPPLGRVFRLRRLLPPSPW